MTQAPPSLNPSLKILSFPVRRSFVESLLVESVIKQARGQIKV